MVMACSTNGAKMNTCRILVEKRGRRPQGRHRRRWEDNNKMDLTEIGWGGMDWIDLAHDRYQSRALLNMVRYTFGYRKMLENS
jgi:hypothetical protein